MKFLNEKLIKKETTPFEAVSSHLKLKIMEK
jgi:hypothetical protein